MIYKALFYRLFKFIEQVGGRNIALRTNGLLSFILILNFSSILFIITKTVELEMRHVEVLIAIVLAGIFLMNYLLFTHKKRYKEIFEELELNVQSLGLKSNTIVAITVVLTILIFIFALKV